ncbi:acyl-CoA N-acyltransferase [Lasiosphaeria miniovina]|uniref:Acyl-CoA N-acyltransferase n=1 Tax=Lasiosphaeria miniovina TaxID=1954250 RepID=A0AA40DXU1_9PEZI|nr:acyl-CoA N-acyltransferase [Lasiosphaeria miniovina]KAK0717622.1 acyl-CoA N-acyltransferase [Lasiosphaeria miniovina]
MEEITAKFATAFRSKRLIYRAVDNTEADRELLACTLHDPVSQGLGDPTLFRPVGESAGKKAIEQMIDQALLAVVICLPAADEQQPPRLLLPGTDLKQAQARATPIGSLFLSRQRQATTAHWRWTRLAVGLAEPFQNKGLGAEAIAWALGWAFDFAGMHRVELGTASYNARALAVYDGLGFTREGRRREAIYSNRTWHDLVEFGMLEAEWDALRATRDADGGTP